MNAQSSNISAQTLLELIALVQAGQMTVETFTELVRLAAILSYSNAKTTSGSTSADGSANFSPRLTTQAEWLGYSSIRGEGRQTHLSNMRRSHSGCSCNSSKRPDTSKE